MNYSFLMCLYYDDNGAFMLKKNIVLISKSIKYPFVLFFDKCLIGCFSALYVYIVFFTHEHLNINIGLYEIFKGNAICFFEKKSLALSQQMSSDKANDFVCDVKIE